MRLGEMLVRDGHVSPDQIEIAVAKQGQDGGRFGTVLAELGFVDLDTITVYLGLELGLPIASGAMLDRAKRTAVRLLRPEQAARLRCVPLLISERQLIAALDDPHDMVALDELAKLTGYRIIPRVAPEVRVYYYLERYYGVPRPERFRLFGDAPRGQRQAPPNATARMPGPSLPGLPPITDKPVAAPTPAPVLRTKPQAEKKRAKRPSTPPPSPAERRGQLESEAESLVVELEADAAETADEAPPTEAFEAIAAATEFDNQSTGKVSRGELFAPQTLEASLRAMDDATQRGEIADAVLCHARELFDVAALFVVRDNMAFGWKGFGPEMSRDRLEALLVPLDAPSIFHAATEEPDGVFAGAVFPSVIHRHLFKVVRTAPPKQAIVGVVRIGRRGVNLLYGHKSGKASLADPQIDGIKKLMKSAADAYVRLIALKKRPGSQDDAGE